MKINLSGHHVDVTDSIKEHINEKFSKIESHFPSLIALDIILSKEHHKFQAEIRRRRCRLRMVAVYLVRYR